MQFDRAPTRHTHLLSRKAAVCGALAIASQQRLGAAHAVDRR